MLCESPDEHQDDLLSELHRVMKQAYWRRRVEPAAFDRLWARFRRSTHRWVLGAKALEAVPPPPTSSVADLRRWAEDHGAMESFGDLQDEIGADEKEIT